MSAYRDGFSPLQDSIYGFFFFYANANTFPCTVNLSGWLFCCIALFLHLLTTYIINDWTSPWDLSYPLFLDCRQCRVARKSSSMLWMKRFVESVNRGARPRMFLCDLIWLNEWMNEWYPGGVGSIVGDMGKYGVDGDDVLRAERWRCFISCWLVEGARV